MIWHDIVIDRDCSDRELVSAIAKTFSVAPADVLVRHGAAPLAPALVDDSARVLCERYVLPGAFPLQLGLVLRDPGLERIVASVGDIPLLQRLCAQLRVNGLAEDPLNHPYAALYVPLHGAPQRVFLDAERLDDANEYVMVHVAATVG
jgi:hypothetical protein